jgi:hypothetical protein
LVAVPDLLSDFQRAFLSGVDGIADSLSVLDTILTEARRKCRSLHLASLDVSKAFDTVSQMAIVEACEGVGLPQPFVEYVRSYGSATTLLELGRRSIKINEKRGVRQGDPLSPLIFNVVLDRALRLLTDVGFRLGTSCITTLAFADDVILCGITSWELQRNLEIFAVEASAANALAAGLPFAQILPRLDIWKIQCGHPATSGHSCSECHPDLAAPTPRRTGGILSRAD